MNTPRGGILGGRLQGWFTHNEIFSLWAFWKDVAFSVGRFAGQCERKRVANRQGSILAACATRSFGCLALDLVRLSREPPVGSGAMAWEDTAVLWRDQCWDLLPTTIPRFSKLVCEPPGKQTLQPQSSIQKTTAPTNMLTETPWYVLGQNHPAKIFLLSLKECCGWPLL